MTDRRLGLMVNRVIEGRFFSQHWDVISSRSLKLCIHWSALWSVTITKFRPNK